jgi:hypothetical protein
MKTLEKKRNTMNKKHLLIDLAYKIVRRITGTRILYILGFMALNEKIEKSGNLVANLTISDLDGKVIINLPFPNDPDHELDIDEIIEVKPFVNPFIELAEEGEI